MAASQSHPQNKTGKKNVRLHVFIFVGATQDGKRDV